MQVPANRSLDEFVIGPRVQRSWGLPVTLDLFFEGAGAGLIAVGAALDQKPTMLAGLVALLLGGLLLLTHLGHPERAWRAVRRPHSSWISRGVLLVSGLLLFTILALLPPLAESGAGGALRVIAGIFGVLVMFYTGAVTSASAIPAWNSALVPFISLAFSIATGIAVALAVASGTHTGNLQALQVGQLLLLAACVLSALLYVSMLSSSTPAGRQSSRLLLRGALALPFLGGVLLLGLVAPFALTWFAYAAGGGAATVALALGTAFRLIGDLTLRHSLLRAGLYDPLL